MKVKFKKILISLVWVVFITILALVATYLLVIANGYKVDYKNFKITKTGLIYIQSDPKVTEVWVNGELLSYETPFKYSELLPGRYEIKLVKYGYVDWETTFEVEPGMVSSNGYIEQFLSSPEQVEPTESEVENLTEMAESWKAKGLSIQNENEVWFSDVLVTRFSEPVKRIVWHQDLKHIFFQVGKEIRVMEPDGSNNTKLVELESDVVSTFVPLDNGKYLLYSDGDTVKKVRIQ